MLQRAKYLAKLSILGLSGIVAACNSTTGISSQNNSDPITINSVAMVNNSPGDFSLYIHFSNSTALQNWIFGFYQPYSYTSIAPWNPNLTLQICQEPSSGIYTNCEALIYNQTSAGSAGWTTALSVADGSSFATLAANSEYAIIALHNILGNPRNYSSFPQSFFLNVNGQISNLATKSSIYQVSDYKQAEINAQINQHLDTNWNNSLTNPSNINIVPYPVSYTANSQKYIISNGLVIHNSLSTTNAVSDFYQATLKSDIGIDATTNTDIATSGIIIQALSNPAQINNNPEGYTISVTNSSIIVGALNDSGAYHALQSLRQLWNASLTIPGMNLVDYPRFKYRGMTLDSARHFFTPSEVKHLIDLMAFSKLNTLHWHLTDDEGYRIAQISYPTLSSIGANRGYGLPLISQLLKQANLDVISGVSNPQSYASATSIYSGSYSAADIATIINYANARYITVIPEIDLPGHARALRKALPNAYLDPNDLSVYASVQGFDDNVIPVCTYKSNISVGPEFTFTTEQIVNATASLFNNQTTLYAIKNEVSLGGDEVSGNAWSNDSSCQGQWASMSALAKAQYFFQLFSQSNPSLIISGWQQLVQNDDVSLGSRIIPAAQTGHIWVWNASTAGIQQAASLADAGYPVVLDFSDQVYFDLTYTPDQSELGQYWATSYSDTNAALQIASSSTAAELATSAPANILGVEGNLWSENLVTEEDLFYLAAPKIGGLAEAAWSASSYTNQNGQVNWQSLAQRLGCGQSGYLYDLNKLYAIAYRGYPNGISLEVPSNICN